MHQLFLIFLNPNFSKGLGFEAISSLIFFDRFLGFDLICGFFRFFGGFRCGPSTGFITGDWSTTAAGAFFSGLPTGFDARRFFMTRLRQSLAQGEKMSNVDTWFPYPMMRSRFLLQYNIRYGSISDSLYSKSEYFFQLLPCLEFTYALRKAFGVPVGVGRILNADEVMTYRYDPPSRSWHVWFVSLTLYLSI